MTKADFSCMDNTITKTPIENALSLSWAKSAILSFSNFYMRSQVTSPHSGFADYYINGNCNCIIEFIRNGSTATCDEHLNRFLSGDYPWERFILVNFDMREAKTITSSATSRGRGRVKVVLPTNKKYHDIFFTYIHSENTLYRGNIAILSPAVEQIESASRIEFVPPMGNFIGIPADKS